MRKNVGGEVKKLLLYFSLHFKGNSNHHSYFSDYNFRCQFCMQNKLRSLYEVMHRY